MGKSTLLYSAEGAPLLAAVDEFTVSHQLRSMCPGRDEFRIIMNDDGVLQVAYVSKISPELQARGHVLSEESIGVFQSYAAIPAAQGGPLDDPQGKSPDCIIAHMMEFCRRQMLAQLGEKGYSEPIEQ